MMKLYRLFLIAIVVANLGMATTAHALDLYVDTTTKQIYAEPGPGRVHMGTFVKADNAPAKTEPHKVVEAPVKTQRIRHNWLKINPKK